MIFATRRKEAVFALTSQNQFCTSRLAILLVLLGLPVALKQVYYMDKPKDSPCLSTSIPLFPCNDSFAVRNVARRLLRAMAVSTAANCFDTYK